MIAKLTGALTSARGQWWLLCASAVESTALLAAITVPAAVSGRFQALRTTGVLLTAAAAAVSFFVLPAAPWLARARVSRWLARDPRIPGFILRLATCVLTGVVAFVAYKLLLDAAAARAGSLDPYAGMSRPVDEADIGTFIVGLGLLAAWPASMYLFVLGQAGALALALSCIARVRGIVRRGR